MWRPVNAYDYYLSCAPHLEQKLGFTALPKYFLQLGQRQLNHEKVIKQRNSGMPTTKTLFGAMPNKASGLYLAMTTQMKIIIIGGVIMYSWVRLFANLEIISSLDFSNFNCGASFL